ncbi:UDP-N-acetylmuramoyl-tripeptide--D-alanyl-D-alanine ligase [Luteibacter sp. UNCMF366Tsu5.1]|uniref:UDP-N-acetylmuramoyl-tripeptide--D-alanyl-D- alanine ligase n=1 Tax=Luteibacter sp. UNCMF366Tsu5.1 TaxID=1502758 RepID=UPI00090879EC|nr:UDP-N-acetylmuramoyl-tripeptide--D-alanyl-D-alanine ligase [Luteibacter sp. UNCMF366Tsu5.1]SFW43058.1 UDP-N-acetylmuramoyl-tripeptide--D-alanyl-D-alanine ligase [Luteibacter sp. UNCMF366Tsu5.1]
MMRLSAVALWTRGRLQGADAEVNGFSIDTRTLKPGDLYVALPGERVDGHDFVAAAAERGAVAALVTRPVDASIPQVIVDDTQAALGDLASAVRAQRNVRVVGITGSNGKTTVKTLTASILSRHGRTHVNAGNYNNEIGMPLTLLAMPEDTEYAVLEMGAGKPGDIDYLAAIARPDIGLITSIAPAHLERMGTIEGVAETKGALYRALPADGVAIINADDERFSGFFANLAGSHTILRYGLEHRADIGADIVEERIDGTHFILSTPHGDGDVRLPLPGRHNVANALAAAAIATALGVPVERIVEGLEQAPHVSGRLNLEPMRGGWTLIDDSYNANPGSAAAAIDTLALARGERWLILGDMAELGPEAIKLHASIGRLAHERGIERLLATGTKSAAAVEAFGPGAQHFVTQEELIEAACTQIHEGVTCLVKGSRSSGMERVANAMKKYAEGASHAA